MPTIEPAEKLLQKIMKLYSTKPHGWHVLHTQQGDLLVLGPSSSFQFKIIPLSPYDFTGVGCELRKNLSGLDAIRSAPSFGLRPLSESDLNLLMKAFQGDASSQKEIQNIIHRDPISLPELTSSKVHRILSGPILVRPNLDSMDPFLVEISKTLSISADQLFEEKYPFRAGMFF